MNVAFVIYDAAVDATGKPDVRVEYRLYHQAFPADRLLGSTPAQALDASTLPPTFDPRTGQQLAAMQSLPLSAYQAGSYRLVIQVTDNRNGASAEGELRFTIAP